jgi:predicted porin
MKNATKYVLVSIMAFGSITASAQSGPTLYGRLDLSFDRTTIDGNIQTQVRSNASRWGIRGVEDLGSGLKAIYGLEFGVNADADMEMTTRNSYVGLSGSFGAFAIGRLDNGVPTRSPVYALVTQNIDFAINDVNATAIGQRIFNARNRRSNSIGYITPNFKGLTFMARHSYDGEETIDPDNPSGHLKNEDDIKQLQLGLNYRADKFGVGVGYGRDRRSGGLANANFDRKAMLAAHYDFGPVKVYGSYGRDRFKEERSARRDRVDFWLLGASAPVGANGKITANYMERDVQSDKDGVLKKFQISYGHRLSKRTMLYVLYDRDDPNSNARDDVITNITGGIRHNF